MSRRFWRCRSATCPEPHGAVLGRLTATGDLVLDLAVAAFRVHLDTRRAMVICPRCGAPREFRGGSVYSARSPGGSARVPSTSDAKAGGGEANRG